MLGVAASAMVSATQAEPVAPQLLNFPENQEARAQAKAENRPCLVLWYGSDWHPEAKAIAAEWNKLAAMGLPLVFGQIDERLGTIPDLSQRSNMLPVGEFHDLPVAVLLAPDDTLLGIYRGATVQSAEAMAKALRRTLEQMPRYLQLVEKARTAEGVEGALAAADALAMMPHADAVRNRALKDILNRKDPEHMTMCRYLYCMNHMEMYAEINAVLNGGRGADVKYQGNGRRFDDAIAFVQKVLTARRLNTDICQQWTAGLAYICREKYRATQDPSVRRLMVETYRRIVWMNPASEYAKGARRWADYWDESTPYVFEAPFYDSGDMTVDFEKEWRVNVSDKMAGPGTYTFTLVPYKFGEMSSRAYQLFADGKLVCKANEPADQSTKKVTFNVPHDLKGRVEVRFMVRCYDGWYACAGEMVMQKN